MRNHDQIIFAKLSTPCKKIYSQKKYAKPLLKDLIAFLIMIEILLFPLKQILYFGFWKRLLVFLLEQHFFVVISFRRVEILLLDFPQLFFFGSEFFEVVIEVRLHFVVRLFHSLPDLLLLLQVVVFYFLGALVS